MDLFDLDPELVDGATGPLAVPLFSLPCGRVQAPRPPGPELDSVFLIVKGLLRKDVSVCGRRTAELVAAGDCVRFDQAADVVTLTAHADWIVLDDALLAEIDAGEQCPARLARTIAAALVVRAAERVDHLALQRAICAHVRVDVRLLAYLWYLADRFGVVTPEGIRLQLPLTHSTLARLIGARRPTVTTAIRRLSEGDFVRRDGRDFLLLTGSGAVEELARSSTPSQAEASTGSGVGA